MNPTDEGELRLAVAVDQGNVVINFGKPVVWLALPPQAARQLAELLRKHSYVAEGK